MRCPLLDGQVSPLRRSRLVRCGRHSHKIARGGYESAEATCTQLSWLFFHGGLSRHMMSALSQKQARRSLPSDYKCLATLLSCESSQCGHLVRPTSFGVWLLRLCSTTCAAACAPVSSESSTAVHASTSSSTSLGLTAADGLLQICSRSIGGSATGQELCSVTKRTRALWTRKL
jgi:hypothetical protein